MNQDERLNEIVEAYTTHFGNTANVIVDIGTRDGDDAAWLRDRLQAGTVVAFDANPIAAEATSLKYPDFIVLDCAVSDFDGQARFAQIVDDRKDLAGSSSFRQYVQADDVRMIDVVVRRFDTVMEMLKFDSSLDVVKVDVEGYTFEVLRGMGEWLHRVGVFHLETEKFDRHPGHHDSAEVEAFMSTLGFVLVGRSYEWGPTIEDQVWVNTSFINRKMY